MKTILVPVKTVLDANVRPRVKTDGTGIDLSGQRLSMNPFCEIGVEEAVRLKEAGHAEEIVAVSIGSAKSQDTLRQAMAMGADRAIHVQTDATVEPLAIARMLAALVEKVKPDLVILGKQAIDDDCGQTGQMLAGLLDWPQATFASSVVCDGDRLTVTREVDAGLQVLSLPLPAIVTTDLRLNDPRHCSLPNIMKARKKPVDTTTPEELGVDLAPHLQVLGIHAPKVRKAGKIVANVEELLVDLRAVGAI